jgi:hypothetical protein
MTQENQPQEQAERPKSKVEILDEQMTAVEGRIVQVENAVLTMLDKVEELVNQIADVKKSGGEKKTTQRAGADHSRKAVKDTKTGKIYPSKFATGKAVISEERPKDEKGELDPLNTWAWYRLTKLYPDRFVEATEEEAKATWAKVDAEQQAEVEAANKRQAEEEAAKKKAEEEAAKKKAEEQPKNPGQNTNKKK